MREISPQCIIIGDIKASDGESLIEISISKAKKWHSCQKAFHYRYNDKLRPKMKAVALRRGTWVHNCLEQRALGNDWVKTIKELKANEYDKLFMEEKVELGDLPTEVLRIMRAYHQTYLKVDAEYEVIRVEQDFMIRIPNTKIVLVGKIDGIIKHRTSGKIWIVEHKTVKRDMPSEDYRTSDAQTAVYSWVLEQIAEKLGFKPDDVAGVIMDYIKTKPPTIPEILKNGTMSRRKIDCDRYTYIACLKKAGLDPNEYKDFLEVLDENVFFRRIPIVKSKAMVDEIMHDIIRTGKQIIALNGKYNTRNLGWTCERPKCEYRDLCLAELQGLDTSMLIKLNYERSDENEQKDPESESDG